MATFRVSSLLGEVGQSDCRLSIYLTWDFREKIGPKITYGYSQIDDVSESSLFLMVSRLPKASSDCLKFRPREGVGFYGRRIWGLENKGALPNVDGLKSSYKLDELEVAQTVSRANDAKFHSRGVGRVDESRA